MADFQFGPYERVHTSPKNKKPGSTDMDYKIFYNDLIIKEPTTMIDSYLSRDMPLYLPPVLFSRQDTPSVYNFAPRYRTTEYIQLEEKGHKLPVCKLLECLSLKIFHSFFWTLQMSFTVSLEFIILLKFV
ncbi:unnamed protein product [Trichobilharzia regenti]|nr:unnamed protein product [Trichobilharzia regenti]